MRAWLPADTSPHAKVQIFLSAEGEGRMVVSAPVESSATGWRFVGGPEGGVSRSGVASPPLARRSPSPRVECGTSPSPCSRLASIARAARRTESVESQPTQRALTTVSASADEEQRHAEDLRATEVQKFSRKTVTAGASAARSARTNGAEGPRHYGAVQHHMAPSNDHAPPRTGDEAGGATEATDQNRSIWKSSSLAGFGAAGVGAGTGAAGRSAT